MADRTDSALQPESEPESVRATQRSSLRAAVVQFVREKRYEDALGILYRARAERPEDKELATSIGQLKEFLVGNYAKRLGGLDQVAGPIPSTAARSPDALVVGRYVDGVATFGDISEMCPLGRLRTLQVLVALYSGADTIPPSRDFIAPSGLRSARLGGMEIESPPTRRQGVGLADEIDPQPPSLRNLASEFRPLPSAVPATVERRPPSSKPPKRLEFRPLATEVEEDRLYRESFNRGTAAFVQRRYADAIDAFRECERLKPTDESARIMLRRALRYMEG